MAFHPQHPGQLAKTAATLAGSGAAVALVVTALVCGSAAPATQSVAKGGGGGHTFSPPTEHPMVVGQTVVGRTEQLPTIPPTAPETPFAEPRIKAGG